MELNNLNIYTISAVIQGNDEHRERLRTLFGHLYLKGHHVLSEHIAREDVQEWEAQQQTGLTIPQRDLAWLNRSDIAIADVSLATTGGGFEVAYALDTLGIPVLALSQETVRASHMVTKHQHPLLTIEEYSSSDDLISKVDRFIDEHKPQFQRQPRYVGWCGIDGSGKGAMNKAFKIVMNEQGLRVFDAIEYMKTHNALPVWDSIRDGTDALLVCEPTYEGLGRLIREDMIHQENPWSSRTVSAGYAANRQKLFKSLVLPALEAGLWVGSDRHEISSEHYQPLHGESWEGESKEVLQGYVRGLEGNKLALANPPAHFIIAHAPAEVAFERLQARRGKQDDAGYEELTFLQGLEKRYLDEDGMIREQYVRRGTRFIDFGYLGEEEGRPEHTLERAITIMREIYAR